MNTKIAIVTPCFRESEQTLTRMISSVLAQKSPCLHVIVSDGVQKTFHPSLHRRYQESGHELATLSLPYRTNNSGAAPRAIGAAWAFANDCDLVSFLDADNAITPDHIELIIAAAHPSAKAIVTERRVFLGDTGQETPRERAEHLGEHIDTNCLTLSSAAKDLLVAWAFWPSDFGTGEDRIFSALLNSYPGEIARTTKQTVLYTSEWPIHYQLAGLPVPVTARRPNRRAATHFHAPSFFSVIGQYEMDKKWLAVPSQPLPSLDNDALLGGLVLAASFSSEISVDYPFTEVFCARTRVNINQLRENARTLVLPPGGSLLFSLALFALMAFHQRRATFIVHLIDEVHCNQTVDAAIRKSVASSPPKGISIYSWTIAGAQGFALAGSSSCGSLWTALLNTRNAPESETELLQYLADECKKQQVPVARFKIGERV